MEMQQVTAPPLKQTTIQIQDKYENMKTMYKYQTEIHKNIKFIFIQISIKPSDKHLTSKREV